MSAYISLRALAALSYSVNVLRIIRSRLIRTKTEFVYTVNEREIMNNVAFQMRKQIVEMKTLLKTVQGHPDARSLAIAITYAETTLMWLNKYLFTSIGQPDKSGLTGAGAAVPASPGKVDESGE